MNSNPDQDPDWNRLRGLLSLKQHEMPDAEYFENLAQGIQKQLKLEPQQSVHWMSSLLDWLDSLQPRTVLAGGAVCATAMLLALAPYHVDSTSSSETLPLTPALALEPAGSPPSAMPLPTYEAVPMVETVAFDPGLQTNSEPVSQEAPPGFLFETPSLNATRVGLEGR